MDNDKNKQICKRNKEKERAAGNISETGKINVKVRRLSEKAERELEEEGKREDKEKENGEEKEKEEIKKEKRNKTVQR